MSKKLVNGILLDQTPEEIKELEDLRAEAKAHEDQVDQERAEKDALKASAKTKLMNGEALTEDEANVMVGL